MTNLEVRTKLGQEEVVERLKKYFGKGGLGLGICQETPQCLSFEGGGGRHGSHDGTEAGGLSSCDPFYRDTRGGRKGHPDRDAARCPRQRSDRPHGLVDILQPAGSERHGLGEHSGSDRRNSRNRYRDRDE